MTTAQSNQKEDPKNTRSGRIGRGLLIGLGGLVSGALLAGVLAWTLMPGMMIHQRPSKLGFDETVSALEKSIVDNGWTHSGTRDLRKSLSKQGVEFPHRVKIVELCKPEYAADVLGSDRFVATLMPCAIAVYETDAGEVMISSMNTGLMGKMFGGNIAKVMGRSVARDEARILAPVLK
jgi:uncharacterized protein (DUF302 family)